MFLQTDKVNFVFPHSAFWKAIITEPSRQGGIHDVCKVFHTFDTHDSGDKLRVFYVFKI